MDEITVLKDGSAAALYGMQGSQGAILVTTKKATRYSKWMLDYNMFLSRDAVARTPSILSASDYKLVGGIDNGSSTDWHQAIRHTGLSQSHHLAFANATPTNRFRLSLNYRDVKGVLLKDGFKKLNGHLNVTQYLLNDKLILTLDASATHTNAQYGFTEAFRYATTHNPTAPILSNDPFLGRFGGYHQIAGFDDFNPLALIEQSTNEGKIIQYVATGKAAYRIRTDLKWGAAYSMNKRDYFNGQYYNRLGLFRGTNANGLAQQITQDEQRHYLNTNLQYSKNYSNGLNINGLAGAEYQVRTMAHHNEIGRGFRVEADYNSLSLAQQREVLDDGKDYRTLASWYGRLNLDYNDIWFLMMSVRQDGSSMLAKGHQWGLFPAISGGLNLNQILNDLQLPTGNRLKLRAGYGLTGALPPSERLSQTAYQLNGQGLNVLRNGNSELKWEQKRETNVGIDFAFWNYRLQGSVDYYQRTMTDLLYFFENTPSGLFEAFGMYANGGQMSGSGVELSLSYAILKPKNPKALNWNVNLVLGTNKTIMDKLSTDALQLSESGMVQTTPVGAPGFGNDYMHLIQEGQAPGSIWTHKFAGTDPNGNVLGYDRNGMPKLIQDLGSKDRKIFGTGLPTTLYSINNQFKWRNFDLSICMRGTSGHFLVNQFRMFYENRSVGSIFSYNRTETALADPFIKDSKWTNIYIEKGNFIKIDNFRLGYEVKLREKSRLRHLNLFLAGNNIATFTNYTGADPEVRYSDIGPTDNGNTPMRQFNPDPLAAGIDRRTTYLPVRSYSIGVNIGF
jgi:TonB-dependent starch-binding outer membrane protein SusC